MRKIVIVLILLVSILFFISFTKTSIFAAAPIVNYLVLKGGYVKATSSNPSSPSFFSFQASINPTSVSGKQIILSIGDKNISKRYYEIGINGGSLFADYGYNGFNALVNTSGLSAGTWQDIRVVITTSQTSLSIDGRQSAPFITNTPGPIGPNIVLGDSYKETLLESKPYKGLIDEVSISTGTIVISVVPPPPPSVLQWHLDESRGQIQAYDGSGHNLHGTLIGGDSLIHFFGVLPTPTPTPTRAPFGLPPIQWNRPILPTLSFQRDPSPTPTINLPDNHPSPTISDRFSFSDRIYSVRPTPLPNCPPGGKCILQARAD